MHTPRRLGDDLERAQDGVDAADGSPGPRTTRTRILSYADHCVREMVSTGSRRSVLALYESLGFWVLRDVWIYRKDYTEG